MTAKGKYHALPMGADKTICDLYFLPVGVPSSNVPKIPPYAGPLAQMPIDDGWRRPSGEDRVVTYGTNRDFDPCPSCWVTWVPKALPAQRNKT